MPITNITHSACYTVEMGVSAEDLTRITLDNNHTAYKHICLQGIGCVCVKNYPPEIMQPSSSKRATIVSSENQNGATIVKATFFLCHYYIVWESNNAGEARGQSWNESLKSRWIPGGSLGYTSGTKRKHFAALSSPRPCWRWLQLQPSCGSPQWLYHNDLMDTQDTDKQFDSETCAYSESKFLSKYADTPAIYMMRYYLTSAQSSHVRKM